EALAVIRATNSHRVVGLLDDDERLLGQDVDGVEVLGGLDSIERFPEAQLLLCAGAGHDRRLIQERLAAPPDRYATVLASSVDLAGDTVVGRGSILLGGVVATASVDIGSHVVIMPNVVLTHDNRIRDFATLCAGVTLGGAVDIEPEAYLGMASTVRQGVRVGAGGTLGMGSVLLTDLPPHEAWAGVPAHQLNRPRKGPAT
ncbi:acetyltransferase, partial [Ornithinicoccus hortensis]